MRSLDARLLTDRRSPFAALPIETFGGWLVRHALPPDSAVRSEGGVGEDRITPERGHSIRIGFFRSAGRNAEEPGLGIDGAQAAVFIGFNPCDVIAHGPDFPAFKSFRRHQHCKIGLSVCARKCRGDVRLFAFGTLDAENQHVLGKPSLIPRNVGSNTEGETFFSKQRIAAIARTVRPDLARFREVNDVLFFIARPRYIHLAGLERRAYS